MEFLLKEALKPGDKLPTEKELAQQLGIGRTSLREGLRQLETVGLLSSRQGKGVYLKEVTLDSLFASGKHIPIASFLKLSKQEILDWLSVRTMFESEACRLAAERITEEELAALQKIQQTMSAAGANREDVIAQAVNFHKQILLASGNAILAKLYDFIEDIYSKQIAIFMNFPQAMEHSLFYHGEILRALMEHDMNAVVKNLHAHIADVKKAVIENFDALESGEVRDGAFV